MARPPARITDEQKRVLAELNKAIERARRIAEREEEKIWAVAKRAREAGIPDVQICRFTGLNRSTLQRRLGAREDDPAVDQADQ